MSKPVGKHRLADGPFKLIETPVHAQQALVSSRGNDIGLGFYSNCLQKPYDQYVEGKNIATFKCASDVRYEHHLGELFKMFNLIISSG